MVRAEDQALSIGAHWGTIVKRTEDGCLLIQSRGAGLSSELLCSRLCGSNLMEERKDLSGGYGNDVIAEPIGAADAGFALQFTIWASVVPHR